MWGPRHFFPLCQITQHTHRPLPRFSPPDQNEEMRVIRLRMVRGKAAAASLALVLSAGPARAIIVPSAVSRRVPLAAASSPRSFSSSPASPSPFLALPPAVTDAARALGAALDESGVPYAVCGAVACSAHGHMRATREVDVLVNAEDLPRLRGAIEGRGWVARYAGARRSFRNAATGVEVDVLVSGEFPGDEKPKPVAFPRLEAAGGGGNGGERPLVVEGVRVLDLVPLIQLKLASGTSAPDRKRDLADVQALIVANRLPLNFAVELDTSVKPSFVALWDEVEEGRRARGGC
jgi:hypothetical protein